MCFSISSLVSLKHCHSTSTYKLTSNVLSYSLRSISQISYTKSKTQNAIAHFKLEILITLLDCQTSDLLIMGKEVFISIVFFQNFSVIINAVDNLIIVIKIVLKDQVKFTLLIKFEVSCTLYDVSPPSSGLLNPVRSA